MKRTPTQRSAPKSTPAGEPGTSDLSNGRKRPWLLAVSVVLLLAWLGFLTAMALR